MAQDCPLPLGSTAVHTTVWAAGTPLVLAGRADALHETVKGLNVSVVGSLSEAATTITRLSTEAVAWAVVEAKEDALLVVRFFVAGQVTLGSSRSAM